MSPRGRLKAWGARGRRSAPGVVRRPPSSAPASADPPDAPSASSRAAPVGPASVPDAPGSHRAQGGPPGVTRAGHRHPERDPRADHRRGARAPEWSPWAAPRGAAWGRLPSRGRRCESGGGSARMRPPGRGRRRGSGTGCSTEWSSIQTEPGRPHRDEVPGPPPALEMAFLLGHVGLGEADLAVRRAADPDRDAREARRPGSGRRLAAWMCRHAVSGIVGSTPP